jgi:hypothetical protein
MLVVGMQLYITAAVCSGECLCYWLKSWIYRTEGRSRNCGLEKKKSELHT